MNSSLHIAGVSTRRPGIQRWPVHLGLVVALMSLGQGFFFSNTLVSSGHYQSYNASCSYSCSELLSKEDNGEVLGSFNRYHVHLGNRWTSRRKSTYIFLFCQSSKVFVDISSSHCRSIHITEFLRRILWVSLFHRAFLIITFFNKGVWVILVWLEASAWVDKT